MNEKKYAEQICGYFDEIATAMSEIENEINNLYICSPDDIELSVEKINEYKQCTEELFGYIDEICDEDKTGELRKAVQAVCDRKEIRDEYECIYEARQEIQATAYRMIKFIPQVSDRLARQKEKTLEDIKLNNTSQSAHASKYYSAVNDDLDTYHFSRKSRSI